MRPCLPPGALARCGVQLSRLRGAIGMDSVGLLGERQGRRTVVARGGTSGFMSILQYFPEAEIVVVALLNQDFMLQGELFDRLAGIALGETLVPLFSPRRPETRGSIRWQRMSVCTEWTTGFR